MRIDNEDERGFYEIEAASNQWSLPELRRQFNSSLYERLALSRDKKKVKLPDEGPTVGILLCKEKNDALVEITLPRDNRQIFARKYQFYLPTKAQLRAQLKGISL
jgi:hypothetical protein